MSREASEPAVDFPPGTRSRVKRNAIRGYHDRTHLYSVLDAELLCHVGYVIDGQPYITPTAYWRDGDRLYWHGSSASRMIRTVAQGIPVCFTVSIMDGLVLARSGFHHSFNYRSVMAFGTAALIEDPKQKTVALKDFMERIAPGRWAECRPMTKQELKATSVVSMEIEEVSVKIRDGAPVDDEEDYDHPIWAGVLPVRRVVDSPVPDERMAPGVATPDYLSAFRFD